MRDGMKRESENKKQRILLVYIRLTTLIFVFAVLATLNVFASGETSAQFREIPKHVLIVNSHNYGMPWQGIVNQAIYDVFEADTDIETQLHAEFTGLSQKSHDSYIKNLIDLFSLKYGDKKIDLIITVDVSATDFLIEYEERLFPNKPPIVFISDTEDIADMGLKVNMTGILPEIDVTRTVDLALQLHPSTQHIAIISGASKMDRLFEAETLEVLTNYESRFDFIDLTGLPMDELLARVSRLPEHTLAVYVLTLVDGSGESFIPKKILPRISQASSAPLYGLWDALLGGGIVGGHLSSAEREGTGAAMMALRILGGEKPQDIPIVQGSYANMFDWRQLQRWGISESDLPTGSIVRFKELSFWNLYKLHIITAIVFLAAQTLLIIGLLIHRTKRYRAEQELQDSHNELEFRVSSGRAYRRTSFDQ